MNQDISGYGSNNRKWYETVKGQYPGSQPTLGALRQELTIKSNQSTYNFDFRVANANSTTEQLLPLTDAFGVNELGLFLLVRNKTRAGSGVLQTYPNREAIAPAFANSTADAPSAAAVQAISDLEAIYNGIAAVRIDQQVFFDGLDMRRFRRVPATQQGIFASQVQSSYGDGMVCIEPQLFFDGARKNQVSVTVPQLNGIALEPDNANFELALVCIASGFRVQGGAKLKA